MPTEAGMCSNNKSICVAVILTDSRNPCDIGWNVIKAQDEVSLLKMFPLLREIAMHSLNSRGAVDDDSWKRFDLKFFLFSLPIIY